MRHQRIVSALVVALAAPLSIADDASAVTRSDYDAFMAAYTFEQHRASCERHAPDAYATFAEQMAAWRTDNGASLRRLEPAARRWRLPGDRPLDTLLTHIANSMDEYYASMDQETTNIRCKRVLERLPPLVSTLNGNND